MRHNLLFMSTKKSKQATGTKPSADKIAKPAQATEVVIETPGQESEPAQDPDQSNTPVIDILIPYVTQTVAWEELKIALRSIAKNVAFPHRIILLASELPDWASDKLILIQCDQVHGFENAKAFDAVAKLEKAIASDISDDFVYTYDDVIFLSEVALDDLKFRWSHNRLQDESNIRSFTGSNRWKNVLINTLNRLKVNNLPDYNYETHLPRVFNKELLKVTIEMFGFKRRPYMVPTLYFNSNFEGPDGILDNTSPSVEISKPLPIEELKEAISSRKVLTFNDGGLTEELKAILLEMFPEKSIYEK